MVDDDATIHTVTLTLETTDLELAESLTLDVTSRARDWKRAHPAIDWDVSTGRHEAGRLPPLRLHEETIDEIARRVRGEAAT